MPQYHIDHPQLQKIFKKYELGSLVSVKEIATGLINPVYLLNDSLILRIDLEKDNNVTKFQRESVLYELLPKFHIPTPRLIAIDTSKELLDSPYMLMNFIPGESLRESFHKLSDQEQKDVSFQLGYLAKQIHSIKPEDIGHEDLFKNIGAWAKWTMADFEEQWQVVADAGYLNEEEMNSVTALYEMYKKLDLSHFGRLTHGDFSSGNIQVISGKVVGVFDFEFTFMADPLWDLQKLPIAFQLGDGFDKKEFLRGYGHGDFTEEEQVRLKMYCYIQGVWEIWATITQHMQFGQGQIREGVELIQNTMKMDI